jgi:hypothetical protein
VNVQYEEELLPARALCFYRKKGEDGVDVPYALVHGINKKRKLSPGFVNSLLTTHYHMHYHSTKPVINSIPVASIDSAIMAFLHERSTSLFNDTDVVASWLSGTEMNGPTYGLHGMCCKMDYDSTRDSHGVTRLDSTRQVEPIFN